MAKNTDEPQLEGMPEPLTQYAMGVGGFKLMLDHPLELGEPFHLVIMGEVSSTGEKGDPDDPDHTAGIRVDQVRQVSFEQAAEFFRGQT